MSRLTEWRDAIRDDEDLDKTARLVAFVLSTYMNRNGEAWPSKATLARGCNLGAGRRAVDKAVDRLEAAGFLTIQRSKGRHSFRYFAQIPTSQVGATLGGATSHESTSNVALFDAERRKQVRPKAFESNRESATPEALAEKEIESRPELKRWLATNGALLADDPRSFNAELKGAWNYSGELAEGLRQIALEKALGCEAVPA